MTLCWTPLPLECHVFFEWPLNITLLRVIHYITSRFNEERLHFLITILLFQTRSFFCRRCRRLCCWKGVFDACASLSTEILHVQLARPADQTRRHGPRQQCPLAAGGHLIVFRAIAQKQLNESRLFWALCAMLVQCSTMLLLLISNETARASSIGVLINKSNVF